MIFIIVITAACTLFAIYIVCRGFIKDDEEII